ncbi:GNAT family N-acetyltransferase [Clostridium sp. CS001]|uniref:GNAT family N-acetyltransferase n=1 Tax=Clostridium sp. CS001 TaxID=2880648 RepID=UPI001CF2679B|nr:GNAT family N-acetyltransferase [Clostridium sp. CS001]MCB2290881.1 GNAT family N-acetyltransferase [Clostridium sp. CS001]
MAITYQKYKDIDDYKRICTFLEKNYESYGTRFDHNLSLFQFQCALSCGLEESVKSIDEALEKVFLWFDDDKLIGILEDGAFCIAVDYRFIFDEIVKIAEEFYSDVDNNVECSVYDKDTDYENVLLNRGYNKSEEYWVRRDFDFNNTVSRIDLPEGFYIELVPNLKEHDEVYRDYKLCYGILFNKNIFQNFYKTSTYKKELDLVVIGPDRNVVALCSGRYDEKNKLVTIEAVSCYHDYRGRGISKALLLHELNIAKDLGADKVTVYTAMPEKYPAPNKLYESVGFKVVGNIYVWKKHKNI